MIYIPFTFLFSNTNYMIAVGLFTIVFFLANYQSLVTIIVSRRFGLFYSLKDYVKIILFIPIEIVTYRFLGIPFVIIGTILYFKNKEGWIVSRRASPSTFENPTSFKETV